MRLIDADALIHELNNSHYPGAPYVDAGISIAIGKICDAPTIEEHKTGWWQWLESGTKGFICSKCGNGYRNQPTLMGKPMFEYCPICGAKMEAGDAETKNMDEIDRMKYWICCPMCDNEKCVRGTDKCEAEQWAREKRKEGYE